MTPGRLLAARRTGAALLALWVHGGCGMAHYLGQAAAGQLALWRAQQPITRVTARPDTPPRLKALLELVPRVRAFGAEHGLRSTRHYQSYVALDRPAVCWVVSASAPLRLEPTVWSFPVVGSFPYLGWFDRRDALEHAETLRAEGLDVDVRPVGAYSTLGFLADPVLSSMVPDGPTAAGELANVILHESVHSTLHVDGQGTFNESLASFVADGLTPVFLAQAFGEDAPERVAWDDAEKRGAQVLALLRETTATLEQLYASPLTDDEKRARKWALLADVRERHGLRRPLNNAVLQGYRVYASGEEAFAQLLARCGNDHARLLETLRTHARFDGPQQLDLGPVLMRVLAHGCGSRR